MSLICPACNKPDQNGAVCQRCGCDLSQLDLVARAASACLWEARRSFQSRDWQEALAQAQRSWQLCHSQEAARFAFLASSALGDSTQAFSWHRHASLTSDLHP